MPLKLRLVDPSKRIFGDFLFGPKKHPWPLRVAADQPSADRIHNDVQDAIKEGVIIQDLLGRIPPMEDRSGTVSDLINRFGKIRLKISHEESQFTEAVVECEVKVIRHLHNRVHLNAWISFQGTSQPVPEAPIHLFVRPQQILRLKASRCDEPFCVWRHVS